MNGAGGHLGPDLSRIAAIRTRDMLIRSATPPGATGRVYGVVYSGLDVGIAVAPVAFGGMLDRGFVAEVFYGIALCLGFAIVTAWRVGRGGRTNA